MSTLADYPRVELLFGPSPVHALERLTEHLGGRVPLWAKREDCNSGLAYGGNKVRKLEYLAADALAQGCDTLVSVGGVQSNHTRQVAAVAARLGLGCVLVQEHWVDWDEPGYEEVGNILLSRIMGADVRLSEAGFDIGLRPSWEEALASVEEAGGKPYAIPAGASDHPLGGRGFARWAEEVATQEAGLGVFFDTIVVCSVTGSTQAGMVAGFAGQERPRTVLGIDASATVEQTRAQVARIARHTAEAIGLGRDLGDDEVVLLDGWHAGTYGIPDEKTIEAIRLCARLEGMLTDPVYEGKSMATPGATVNHDGQTFTWPDVPPAQPDNTATDGQVIATSGGGAKIGFLGAGCCGIQTGTLYVTYTDGSIARAPLTFADWWTNAPVPGSDIVATSPWNVPPGNPDPDHPVSVYYTAIPLDPGKTVRFITLPTNLNLHVFAVAIG